MDGLVKKLISRKEIFLLLGAALIALFLFWTGGNTVGRAHLSIDGKEVLVIELATARDEVVYLYESFGMPGQLEVYAGRVRFINVECPDLICVRTGWIWRDGQAAVCLPNRAAVVIVGAG